MRKNNENDIKSIKDFDYYLTSSWMSLQPTEDSANTIYDYYLNHRCINNLSIDDKKLNYKALVLAIEAGHKDLFSLMIGSGIKNKEYDLSLCSQRGVLDVDIAFDVLRELKVKGQKTFVFKRRVLNDFKKDVFYKLCVLDDPIIFIKDFLLLEKINLFKNEKNLLDLLMVSNNKKLIKDIFNIASPKDKEVFADYVNQISDEQLSNFIRVNLSYLNLNNKLHNSFKIQNKTNKI